MKQISIKLWLVSAFIVVMFSNFLCSKEDEQSQSNDDLTIGGENETWVSYKFGDDSTVNKATTYTSFKITPDSLNPNNTDCKWSFTNNKLEAQRTMCNMQFDSRGGDKLDFYFYWEPVAGANSFLERQSYNLNTINQSGSTQTAILPTWGVVFFNHNYTTVSSTFNTGIKDNNDPYSQITIEKIDYNTSVSPAVQAFAYGKFYIAYKCPNSNYLLLEIHGRFNKIPIEY